MCGSFTVILMGLFLAVHYRLWLVADFRFQALWIFDARAYRLVFEGRPDDAVALITERLDAYGSYPRMLFQLHKWTFKQFYPDL